MLNNIKKKGREMKVIVAKTAGFCFGVEKAVEKVYENVGKESLYTYGPIIHNEEVVKDLEKKGVQVINGIDGIDDITNGTVVIRSHGVSEDVYDKLKSKGLDIVDATCPFVQKIHRIVSKESMEGRTIVIIGNEGHPEVEGIKGWAHSDTYVIGNSEDAENLSLKQGEKVCIVSQTTFNFKKFKDLVEIIQKKGYDIKCLNTICNATEERQREAREIASKVDTMIVIGGKHSSNTQKLVEICKSECKDTYYIQTLGDLDLSMLGSGSSVGITAGASTPKKIIEEVHTNVRIKF